LLIVVIALQQYIVSRQLLNEKAIKGNWDATINFQRKSEIVSFQMLPLLSKFEGLSLAESQL